jgi:hypothetical protein
MADPNSPNGAVLRRLVLWSLAGLASGIVAAIVVLRVANYDPTPPLTPELFEAARQRWKAASPPDYDIQVRVVGPQPADYRVEIRSGQPQAAWRNGHPLRQRRTFGTWSVPGMFSTMSRDVEAIERRAAGRAGVNETQLILRAEFDPKYSYPARYKRIEWGSRRGSTAVTVTWEVTEFTVR